MACTSSPFTSLVQPTSSVSTTPSAESFDAGTAYLLGQCCALTYAQFDAGTVTLDSFSAIQLAGSLAGYTLQASNLVPFTVSEGSEPGPTAGDVGDYYQTQGGFGVQLSLTKAGENALSWTVIALRGTRTFSEWLDDAEALPVAFAPGTIELDGQGSVHSGFYADYTTGTDGLVVSSSNALSATVADRAAGSLAAQVGAYLTGLGNAGSVYVTGHSLGAALATLCAMDIALNFPPASLALYALASPRVAVGLSDSWGIPLPTLGNQAMFVKNFQAAVPNTYQIVNAADIVPISPPLSLALGALTITCAQVTDAWEGNGAAGTASIANGAVTEIKVAHWGSGYDESSPPPVVLSGGAGWGASATASVDALGLVTGLNVGSGGFGYTSAPSVSIGQSGAGLCANVITFCAQTGDIGNNHGCLYTYVPYLQALAAGFA